MGFARSRKGLRGAVFAALGDPASVNDGTEKFHMRLFEGAEDLGFGGGHINAPSHRILAPVAAGIKKNDVIAFEDDDRRFRVNAAPVVVRSGVHKLSCEVVK